MRGTFQVLGGSTSTSPVLLVPVLVKDFYFFSHRTEVESRVRAFNLAPGFEVTQFGRPRMAHGHCPRAPRRCWMGACLRRALLLFKTMLSAVSLMAAAGNNAGKRESTPRKARGCRFFEWKLFPAWRAVIHRDGICFVNGFCEH